jgi:hypothetical protein
MSLPRPACSTFECIQVPWALTRQGAIRPLSEARLQPDWVAGVWIGAINAALIAGNVPVNRVARPHGYGSKS